MILPQVGRTLIGLGIGLAILGALLWVIGARIPGGRLPGDVVVQKPGFTLYAPFGLMIVLSVAATLLMWLFGFLAKR